MGQCRNGYGHKGGREMDGDGGQCPNGPLWGVYWKVESGSVWWGLSSDAPLPFRMHTAHTAHTGHKPRFDYRMHPFPSVGTQHTHRAPTTLERTHRTVPSAAAE